MKKRIILIALLVTLVVAFSLVLTGQLTGNAESASEVFQMDGTTLMKYLGNAEVVYVPEQVEVIAQGAFEDNDSIRKVVLPSRLKEIGYNAFAGCDNLLEVDIPDSVAAIGSSAFANCKSLCDVSIGKGVETVGSGVFAGCTALKDISVSPDSKTLTCLNGVLLNADRTFLYQMLPGREEPYYIMSDSVEEIGEYAFWGCDNLEHIILSDKIEIISPYAFSNVSNLKSVSMSFAVKEIGIKAFEDCVNLEQIYITDSVIRIHNTAFDGCLKVNFYTAEGTYGSNYAAEHAIGIMNKPIYSLTYAEEVKREYIESLKEESNSETIAPGKVEIGSDVYGYTTIVGNNAVILMNSTVGEVISGNQTKWNDKLNLFSKEGSIPANAFYGQTSLDKVTIPNGVTVIGKFAFARSSITEVVIPEGTTDIEYAAFYHCNNLSKVTIPDSVTYIAENAFSYTPWMQEWEENGESDYLIVGDGVLIGYKGKPEEFKLPANVKYVACETP